MIVRFILFSALLQLQACSWTYSNKRAPAQVEATSCLHLARNLIHATDELSFAQSKENALDFLLEVGSQMEKLKDRIKILPQFREVADLYEDKLFKVDIWKMAERIENASTSHKFQLAYQDLLKYAKRLKSIELTIDKLETFQKKILSGRAKIKEILSNWQNRLQWSSHGEKHTLVKTQKESLLLAKAMQKAKSYSKKAAQYFPQIDNEILEKWVLKNYQKGFVHERGKHGTWVYMYFEGFIGFNLEKRTQWIRVEIQSGTIHGHPTNKSAVQNALGSRAMEYLSRRPVALPATIYR